MKSVKDYLQKYRVLHGDERANELKEYLAAMTEVMQAVVEEDIEASQFKDANEVLNHIRSL